MGIEGIKAKRLGAGPEAAYVAEAEVTKDGKTVYVTVQMYDGEECTVSKESVYAFLAEDAEPAGEFLEEYEDVEEAVAESEYGDVFRKLADAIDGLE